MKDTQRGLTELLRAASAAGATACEGLMTHSVDSDVVVRRGRVSSQSTSETSNWTLRVWVDGGGSASVVGEFGDVFEGVEALLQSANQAAGDPFGGPTGRLPASSAGLGIYDRRYDSVTDDDRCGLALSAERDARTSDRRLQTDRFEYSDSLVKRAYVNTRGANLEERTTRYKLSGTVEVVSGSERFTLTDSRSGRGFSDVSTLPLGKMIVGRAHRLLKRGGKVSRDMPLILSPRATASIVEAIAHLFTEREVAKGSAFLFRSPTAWSEKLHLLDDGANPGGVRTRTFDDRGVPTVPLTLLRDGRVAGRFLSPEDARRHDTRPTGHCYGDTTRPTNLILRQGARSINAVMTERGDRAFWVDDFADMSGFNLKTGELTTTVCGVVMHGSEVEGGCRNVGLTGNVGVALSNVLHVFSNTDRVRHVDAPAMMVTGFKLAE